MEDKNIVLTAFFQISILECGPTFFKPDIANAQCTKCVENSLADLERKLCTSCKLGYKRAKNELENYNSNCFSKCF